MFPRAAVLIFVLLPAIVGAVRYTDAHARKVNDFIDFNFVILHFSCSPITESPLFQAVIVTFKAKEIALPWMEFIAKSSKENTE